MIHEILNRAEAYQKQGKLDLAIAEYTEALRIDPKHAGAHFGRGMCYGNKGELDNAQLDFDETTRLNPKHTEAFINCGYCWFTKRDYYRAIADYELALRVNPRHVEAINTNDALTLTGAVVGTPCYMSPEQTRNAKEVDFRADIYSLGATLFHLVTGRPPFVGNSPFEVAIKVATTPTPRVREINPNVPPVVAEMIERMLAKSPQARYQHSGELLAALELAVQQPATNN